VGGAVGVTQIDSGKSRESTIRKSRRVQPECSNNDDDNRLVDLGCGLGPGCAQAARLEDNKAHLGNFSCHSGISASPSAVCAAKSAISLFIVSRPPPTLKKLETRTGFAGGKKPQR
jgi:hypothetical protein